MACLQRPGMSFVDRCLTIRERTCRVLREMTCFVQTRDETSVERRGVTCGLVFRQDVSCVGDETCRAEGVMVHMVRRCVLC